MPKLTPDAKRTIRTLVQGLLTLAADAPDIATHLPATAIIGQSVLVLGAVTHWFSVVEGLPGFPAWLKVDAPTPAPSDAVMAKITKPV